ncbi:HIT-like domain-containing protein [Trichoderma chlorosporum]
MAQADAQSDSEEGLTQQEMQQDDDEPPSKRPKQDAFAQLMAPKPKALKPPGARPHLFKNRMALGAYIASPETYPASVVISHSADFVVIHDKFPKATVHTLLLPRSARHSLLHPFEALQDVEFLGKVKVEVERLKVLAAGELRRRLGSFSRADAARQAVLNGEAAPEDAEGRDDDDDEGKVEGRDNDEGKATGRGREPQLPAGRDWAADIMCGVHAFPSMGHLHIHVLSRDMHSPAMKHRKHYNSFNTPFLVDVADFPLAASDPRRSSKDEGYMKRDLVCWRCGTNFGNRFKELKDHLDKEFDEWKRL